MKVKCPCGTWHDMIALDLMIVLEGYQDGDLQTVNTKDGVHSSQCFRTAFTRERVGRVGRVYSDLTMKYRGPYADEIVEMVEETARKTMG
jgi:hypothetical protein